MVIKIYVSGISGNKEVKKRQQRVMMILESKNVKYEVIDITEPGREAEKEFMQLNSMARESKYPLPPQIFNDEDYCGDYENFDESNEMDELDKFLKGPTLSEKSGTHQNGNMSSREQSTDKEILSEALNSTDERRPSETENQSEDKDQDKDLTEDDLDLGMEDEKTDDMSDNQENEE